MLSHTHAHTHICMFHNKNLCICKYNPRLELLLFGQPPVFVSTSDFSAAALQVWLFGILGEANLNSFSTIGVIWWGFNRLVFQTPPYPPPPGQSPAFEFCLPLPLTLILLCGSRRARGQLPVSSESHPWRCSRAGLTFARTQGPTLEFIFPTETIIHKLSELRNVIASEIIPSHNLH